MHSRSHEWRVLEEVVDILFNRVKICEKLSLELGLEIFRDFSKNPQM